MVFKNATSFIEEKKQLMQWDIETLKKDLAPDIRLSYITSLGGYAKDIAFGYAILKNKAEALSWFREAVGYYVKVDELLKEEGKRIRYVHALRLLDAVVPLSKEEEYIKVAAIIEGLPPEPVPGTSYISSELFEAYLDNMAPLLKGNYNEALERLPRLRNSEKKDWKDCQFYEGLSDAIEGIAKQDKDLFLGGLNRVLEIFKRRNAQLKGLPICPEATTLFILVKRRGMDIKLEDIDGKLREFVPGVLVE
ncbi:MAG: hypothetical protein AB1798_13820 [Spirochaetota bacterium]